MISKVAFAAKAGLLLAGALVVCAFVLWRRKRKTAMMWVLSPLLLGAVLLTDMILVEPNWIEVDHVRIHSPVLAPALAGVKIAQISCMHVMDKAPWRLRRMVSLLNAQRPDAILIIGDFLSERGGMEACLKALDRLKRPPFGIWAVPGNTDEIFYSKEELVELCKEHGITMLVNQFQRASWGGRPAFCLAGVDDPTYGREDLDRTLGGIPSSVPVLLMAHSPMKRIVENAADRKVALMLAGHTHGGQVGIPWLRQMSPYANRGPYMSGKFQVKETALYVNRGIGTKTRSIRLLCRPEVTVLEVVK